MTSGTNVIDAAVRFARSNAEVLACAREGASRTGCSVDVLLSEAIARMRAAMEERELEKHDLLERRLGALELVHQPRRYRRRSVAPSRRTESSAYS